MQAPGGDPRNWTDHCHGHDRGDRQRGSLALAILLQLKGSIRTGHSPHRRSGRNDSPGYAARSRHLAWSDSTASPLSEAVEPRFTSALRPGPPRLRAGLENNLQRKLDVERFAWADARVAKIRSEG